MCGVVDYKSGSKAFRLDDVYYGLNLQMLIYLFSIWKKRQGRAGRLPAGGCALPAGQGPHHQHLPRGQRRAGGAGASKAIQDERTGAGGPYLCSGNGGKGGRVFIPVKTKSDGSFDARSSLATLEQMGRIQRHIELVLTEMAQNLQDGQIDATPSVGLGYEPCQYCDYKPICQHQQQDRQHKLTEMGKEGFYQALKEEEDGTAE